MSIKHAARVTEWLDAVDKLEQTPKPRILALDLMSALGWACRADDGVICYGTETFQTAQVASPGMKWMRFRNWLKRIRQEGKPEFVFYEEVRGFPAKNRGRDSKIYYGFETTLLAFCAAAKLESQGVTPQTIKKFIAGSGAASKEAVISAVKALGYQPTDSNQADAIALLLYAEAFARGQQG